jgi:uncharacterized protein
MADAPPAPEQDLPGRLRVEVCRVVAADVTLVTVVLPAGATVADAVAASGLAPAGGPVAFGMAVQGRRVDAARVLQAGDRVDLLAPLVADPKLARQRRADKRRRESGDARWSRRE